MRWMNCTTRNFWRAARLLLALVALGGPASAQRETEIVVYAFVLNQVTATTESEQIRNVGQTQHSIFVRLEDRPALTCTDAGLSVFMEQGVTFEDDPSTIVWAQFGDAVTDTQYGTVGTAFRGNTSGAVQFIRVNPDGFDTTNCFLSVTYIGSVRPVPLFDIGGDTLNIFAEFYNFVTVAADPPCSAGDFFTFYNETDGAYRICEDGVISDVGGGGGGTGTRIVLAMSDAVLLDQTTSNNTSVLSWEKGVLTGLDPFYLVAEVENTQNIQWTFSVPSNFSSAPVLTIWMYPSTAIGSHSYEASVRCVTPDASEDWTTGAFDAVNTLSGVTFSGANDLETLVIPLTNDDTMAAGDLCQVNVEQTSAALVSSFLRAVIDYTGT